MKVIDIKFILNWSHELIEFVDSQDYQFIIKDVEAFQSDLMKVIEFNEDELHTVNVIGWDGINKELDMELMLNQALDLKPTLFSKYVECVNQ